MSEVEETGCCAVERAELERLRDALQQARADNYRLRDRLEALREEGPVYACEDCGHVGLGFRLVQHEEGGYDRKCLECSSTRVDALENAFASLVRERDEARAAVELLRSLTPSGTYSMDWHHEQERQRLTRERDEARAEVERLRQIVSASCAAIGNGSFAAPECSLEFMAGIPAEIAAETRRGREAYQRGAEAMRETAAQIFDAPLSTPGREVLLAWAESIRALPVPEDKP